MFILVRTTERNLLKDPWIWGKSLSLKVVVNGHLVILTAFSYMKLTTTKIGDPNFMLWHLAPKCWHEASPSTHCSCVVDDRWFDTRHDVLTKTNVFMNIDNFCIRFDLDRIKRWPTNKERPEIDDKSRQINKHREEEPKPYRINKTKPKIEERFDKQQQSYKCSRTFNNNIYNIDCPP